MTSPTIFESFHANEVEVCFCTTVDLKILQRYWTRVVQVVVSRRKESRARSYVIADDIEAPELPGVFVVVRVLFSNDHVSVVLVVEAPRVGCILSARICVS